MLSGSHFRLKATEVVPLDAPTDIGDELAATKSKGELVAGLQSLGRKGAMSAMEFGYVEEVAAMLKHPDADVVAAACEAMGNMGPAAVAYANDVAALLTSSSGDVRAAAATATGLLGPAAGQYVDTLKEMMTKDTAENAKCAAIGALGAMGAGDQAKPIAGLLASQSPVVVAAAIQALGELGADGVAEAEGVAKKLDEPAVRYAALCSLLNLGEATIEKYMDKIIAKGLSDPDSLTRTVAAEALGKIPEAVAKKNANVAKIAKYLKDEHPGVRCSAALALGYLGDKAAGQVLDALKALLQDPAEDTSELYLSVGGGCPRSPPASRRPVCAALVALGMLGAESVANDCAECLSSDEWEVKMCALECLAQLGPAAKEQASKISACLEDDVFIVRARACDCLGAVKADDGVHNLPDLFEDKAPSVRSAALMALAECPEVAQSYSNEVFKCMGDPIASVSAAAIYCLGSMGETGRSYASIVATKLYDEDPGVRAAACEALGKLGDHGAAFAEEVAANLQDDTAEVRMKAARALGSMGQEGAAFLSDLGILMQDPFGEVSTAARDAMLALEKF